MSMVEIHIERGGRQVPVVAPTAELLTAIARLGFDPSGFNRVRWPIGMARYATAQFLMLDKHARLAFEGGDYRNPVSLEFNGVVFDRMYALPPKPLVPSEGSGALYAVTLVDERYLWRSDRYTGEGFNLLTNDKTVWYDETTTEDPALWSITTASRELIDGLSGELLGPEAFVIPENDDLLSVGVELRDMMAIGLPIADLMDRLMAQAGYVWVAYPNTGYAPGGGRYAAVAVDAGQDSAQAVLATYGDKLIGGGMLGHGATFSAPASGAGSVAGGEAGALDAVCPSQVRVAFPLAPDDTIPIRFDKANGTLTDGAFDYPIERYAFKTSTDGRPAGVPGNGREVLVFSQKWAILTVDDPGPPATIAIDNDAALVTEAGRCASAYYRRFLSGAGELLLMGTRPVVPYAGAQVVEWSATAIGPLTRLSGTFDDPLFGYDSDRALRVGDILTAGGVRAIPRNQGGLLLDSPVQPRQPFWALISAVTGAVNATYNAECIDDPSIAVTGATPANREFPVMDVDYYPANVGDACIIFTQITSGGRVNILWHVNERFTPTACDPPE